jgi:hypothetical protein
MNTENPYESVEFIRNVVKRVHESYTATSTESSLTGYGLDADNCTHCHAAYGHKILCPLLNRNIAEAQSATLSDADQVRVHAFGIVW